MIKIQERIGLTPVFESREGVQLDAVDSLENALFDIGIVPPQLPQKLLHLLALALAHPVP